MDEALRYEMCIQCDRALNFYSFSRENPESFSAFSESLGSHFFHIFLTQQKIFTDHIKTISSKQSAWKVTNECSKKKTDFD